MDEYVGKICPYCKTEIKEGDEVKVCPECGIPHHATCWEENKGCTTFGCKEQQTNPTDVCSNCGAPLPMDRHFAPSAEPRKMLQRKMFAVSAVLNCKMVRSFAPSAVRRLGL